MPDRDLAGTPLDDRLSGARRRLLDDIDQPGLDAITNRAAALRRRRAAGTGTVAVLAVLFIGTGVAQAVRNADRSTSPATVASTGPSISVWTGAGITISGLPGTPVDLPGTVTDVQFVDADRGYLLATDCPAKTNCTTRFASTEDGGRSWTLRPYPGENKPTAEAAPPLLLTLGGAAIVADGPAAGARMGWYTTEDGGLTWSSASGQVPSPDGTGQPWPAGARPQVVPADGATGCGSVYAWRPGSAGLAPAARQPDLSVCWAAATPAADGGWWVGGISPGTGRPAVAVTRDLGLTWQTHVFDGEPAGATGARVALLGSRVSVATFGARLAIYRSDDAGKTFDAGTTHPGEPESITGDPVPLLDGRLLVLTAAGRWYVTADGGSTWDGAPDLHKATRISRTPAGYVAYRLTGSYTAFSVDGSSWRKLGVI